MYENQDSQGAVMIQGDQNDYDSNMYIKIGNIDFDESDTDGGRFGPGRYIKLKFNNWKHNGIELDCFVVGKLHLNENGTIKQDYKTYSESGNIQKAVV